MSQQITLVSVDCGSGHACELAHGLAKYGEVTKVWQNMNPHGLDFLNLDAKFGYGKLPASGDHLIIVGCITFNRLEVYFGSSLRRFFSQYGKVHIIVTDGHFARNPDIYNKKFKGLDVICTGCKRHFREPLPVKTYYQPFDLSDIDQTKYKRLLIAHSPFGPVKYEQKGTDKIIEAVRDYDFDLITGVQWDECLQRKAKSHIFIDQIDHYDRDKFKFKSPDYIWPALGKSGIEAMHLGCLVITYGKGYNTEIPAPPVAWVTDNFEEVLNYYIYHPTERAELARRGKEWALKYATPEFMAQTVLH